MTWKPLQVAWSTPFDNTENGFDAENVQEAIEEASRGVGLQQVKCRIINGQRVYTQYDNLIYLDTCYMTQVVV
jgi:hypothetical protein